mgnify:CR=1 FL=1
MFATYNNSNMTNNKADQFSNQQQKLAIFGKVLSHPARVAILQLLAEQGEIKTGNISDYLPIARPTVSRHLKELKEMGIIIGSVDGHSIHCCLNIDKLKEIKNEYDLFFKQAIKNFKCSCK